MEKLNGVVETHYGNGQLRSRANYKDGKLNGLFEDWYDGREYIEELVSNINNN